MTTSLPLSQSAADVLGADLRPEGLEPLCNPAVVLGDTMNTRLEQAITIQRSGERAHVDLGWLQTYHSFSFADYYDPENLNWGALRVFNDDVIAPGEGFGTHPHRDMEILTYVLDGELAHSDSMGNVRVVGPGAVQYLSAGTGITHAEYNARDDRAVHLVQMWVTPRARGLAPRYGQVDFTLADRDGRWLAVATGEPNLEAPIAIWQDATAYVARLDAITLRKAVRTGRYAFLFVADGEVTLGGETLRKGDAARLRGPLDIAVSGTGEVVLWDTPPAGEVA